MRPGYRERPVHFGPARSLQGILCVPRASASTSAGPVVVMLSAGVLHRVGPSRVHVELARRLAAVGLTSLRFDLSGIGDSLPRGEAGSLEQAVAWDIDDAMNWLEQADHGRAFVLLGLCSGAFDALQAAQRDERVVGVFSIDLIGSFVNRKHLAVHYLRRLTNPRSWMNALSSGKNTIESLRRRLADAGEMVVVDRLGTTVAGNRIGVRRRLSRNELSETLEHLLSRGVEVAFCFTAGLEENYNYRHQFRDIHPEAAESPRCISLFLPRSDHTLTSTAQRERLIEAFLHWVTSRLVS